MSNKDNCDPTDTIQADTKQRIGFLAGQVSAPKDFDQMDEQTIETLFCEC